LSLTNFPLAASLIFAGTERPGANTSTYFCIRAKEKDFCEIDTRSYSERCHRGWCTDWRWTTCSNVL